uniref:N-acetyltransferase domain-containing protein n=1 Tax=Glossina pallidipes TaxID=7398 RepID=A0A1B0AF20_GLOPL
MCTENCTSAIETPHYIVNNLCYRYRHVQINNDGASEFYKKFGFEIVETHKHYYKCIESTDAFVLEKTVTNEKPPDHAHSNGHTEKAEKKT